ncbi:XRE family transcriptional regulator [Octadecabacter sp. SW4]|uniref:MbcA/ParS/Xre antitoxin family protein n=1 Tax=Octadecabacter sp. SW4 TaxID=2602067 RepID=UPI0011C1FB00|nr:XRE family transcriptional regulator [Octadecabacter sp. SW4]QEE36906.1 XRE family transcriptional regulator [Octadecabacter sp. SW4]|tara:strand:- start:244 stop:624 length:381 start_codon:yes stop_codon:yes gene_type:complete
MQLETKSVFDASPERGRVLAKATFNAARELGMTQKELAEVIGVSEATVSRMKDGGFDLSGKPFELAACLVRLFRSLDAIAGGDPDTIRGWMKNPNSDLHGAPRALIMQAAGLVGVMNYLDGARAPT